jgi:Protein of unknown function (DUF2795)
VVDRGSSKHGPRVDDQLQRETEPVTHTAQPDHLEEWRQTEPFDAGPISEPEEHVPGAPVGMTEADVERRADIAIWLEPGKLPADRDAILDQLRETGAPDDVIAALAGLPRGQEFRTTGEIVRAVGIPTEEPRDREGR